MVGPLHLLWTTSQVLPLDLTPAPQVTEHSVQSDHGENSNDSVVDHMYDQNYFANLILIYKSKFVLIFEKRFF